MRQAQREVSVVCQQEQAAGINIQASNRIHTQSAQFSGKEVKYDRPALWIMGGTDISDGFMQQYVNLPGGGTHRITIHTHSIMFGVNACSLRSDDDAVHLYSSRVDKFYRVAPGGYACMSKKARESFAPVLFLFRLLFLCHDLRSSCFPSIQSIQRFSRQVCA